jgi:hypothetical protein
MGIIVEIDADDVTTERSKQHAIFLSILAA